jgi:histone H3/H4
MHSRALRKTCCSSRGEESSFDSGAVNALQRACEAYLVDVFETSNLCAINSERQKLEVKDVQLAGRLTDDWSMTDNWRYK